MWLFLAFQKAQTSDAFSCRLFLIYFHLVYFSTGANEMIQLKTMFDADEYSWPDKTTFSYSCFVFHFFRCSIFVTALNQID